MANKNVFKSASSNSSKVSVAATAAAAAEVIAANTVNEAGGRAYSLSDESALAQMALTGCFNGTFYAGAEQTLKDLLARAIRVRPEFLAKLAVYSRTRGFMKDSSALFLAVLMVRDIEQFKQVFPLVIDNGKMLRTFVQVVRSGQVGRKSFGSAPKRLIRLWLEGRSDKHLFEDSVGNEPSLVDIIKMVHPKPGSKAREVFYRYLLGKQVENLSDLPKNVQEFEEFKRSPKGERKVPNVPFQMLTALDLSDAEWTEIAKNGRWHQTRMNLNTYARHNVFKNEEVVNRLAVKLGTPEEVRSARVFPYQLYIANQSIGAEVPQKLRDALGDAMEVATQNVGKIKGKVYVGVDYSGSMTAPVTGNRGSATTRVSCNQVGSLMAACILRNSENCTVYRFDTSASLLSLNPRDSVMKLTSQIGANGGGTDCSSVLKDLNMRSAKGDVVFIISDDQSWVTQASHGNATGVAAEWSKFKNRNPSAKLVLVDLAAGTTTQAPPLQDVLHVGGFSDTVFEVVNAFLENSENSPEYWVNKILTDTPT